MPFPSEVISLARYNLGQEYYLEFQENHPAMAALLQELEEDHPSAIPQRHLQVHLQLVKRFQDVYRHYLLVRGDFEVCYAAQCVRCLEIFPQHLQGSFQACFLPDALAQSDEFKDLTDILIDQEEMALYFYTQNKVNLSELLHEQLFLTVPPFPLHDPHCHGLCPECGANLNRESCPHHAATL